MRRAFQLRNGRGPVMIECSDVMNEELRQPGLEPRSALSRRNPQMLPPQPGLAQAERP